MTGDASKRKGGKAKAKRPMGRRTLCTPDVTEAVVEVLEAGGTFEAAAAAVGVARHTLMNWMAKGEEGVTAYRDFFTAAARARERRPLAVLRTLADEVDWRGREAYLKQLQARDTSRANRRIKEAEAELMEAKAAAARSLTSQGGAGMLLLAEDVLGRMPDDLAVRLREYLARDGIAVLERRDLAAGVTDADVARFSPNPAGD